LFSFLPFKNIKKENFNFVSGNKQNDKNMGVVENCLQKALANPKKEA